MKLSGVGSASDWQVSVTLSPVDGLPSGSCVMIGLLGPSVKQSESQNGVVAHETETRRIGRFRQDRELQQDLEEATTLQ